MALQSCVFAEARCASSKQRHVSTHRREIARWILLDGENDTPAVNGKTEDILDELTDPRADMLIALSQCSAFIPCHDFVLLADGKIQGVVDIFRLLYSCRSQQMTQSFGAVSPGHLANRKKNNAGLSVRA